MGVKAIREVRLDARSARRRLLMSTATVVGALAGYARQAYAVCANVGGSTYQCSGANLVTQTVNTPNATVSTLPGFSVDTTVATGNALEITGAGAISYTDVNASPLTAPNIFDTALDVRSTGDIGGGNPGSITVNINGVLRGGLYGLYAINYGSGATSITANGNATSIFADGILAVNYGTSLAVTTGPGTLVGGGISGINAINYGSGALTVTANGNVAGIACCGISAVNYGTSLTVTTGPGTTVVGGTNGINAINYGSGALTVTANGNVTGTALYGIYAQNYGTSLTVTTGPGTTVTGGVGGIFAYNYGSGATTVTVNGNVTGTLGPGILALNYGTSLAVTTGAGTTVTGGYAGIIAVNGGSGALTITVNGNVTGASAIGVGILALNGGASLTVTTGAGTTVTGGYNGIAAYNGGSGATTVIANGNVIGTGGYGVVAVNTAAGTDVAVTTGAGTTVSGGYGGIVAVNRGSGPTTITVNGNVTGGTNDGIYSRHYAGGPINITVGATGTVTSNGPDAVDFAINTLGGPTNLVVAGTLNGGAGGAVRFDPVAALNDRLELQPGAAINGVVLAGPGTDALAFGGAGNGAFNLSAIDTGAGTQQFQSFETFQVNSGIWTFTGATTVGFTVNGGTMLVNGVAGPITVLAGGTLGGTGTVGTTTINGGTLSPGNSIGTFTIAGNLTMNAASTYLVEVAPAAADRTNVTGTANIAGTVQTVFLPPSNYQRSYTILSAAGGLNGTFGTLAATGLPTFFGTALFYTSTDVRLDLTLGLGQLAGLNVNQRSVGSSIDQAFNAGTPFTGAFATLLTLPTAAMPGALSQLSGEIATSAPAAAFRSMDQFLSMMLDPFAGGRNLGGNAGGPALAFAADPEAGASRAARGDGVGNNGARDALAAGFPVKAPMKAPASFEQRWSTWAGAYGGRERRDGDAVIGSHDLSSSVWGFAAGADRRFGNGVFGAAVTVGETSFGLSNGLGSGRTEFAQAGIYGSMRNGPAYVSAALAFGWHQASTSRTVAVAGGDTLRGEFSAQNLGARFEGGWRHDVSGVAVTPYAALVVQSFRAGGYNERATFGSASFALAVDGRTADSIRSELGARFDHTSRVGGGTQTLRARVAWVHDYSDAPTIGATFTGLLASPTFPIIGAAPGRDAALLSGGAEFAFGNGMSFGARFDGELGPDAQSYAGTATFRRVW
jgi:uncharacterized protein with beta-barrel porin domain